MHVIFTILLESFFVITIKSNCDMKTFRNGRGLRDLRKMKMESKNRIRSFGGVEDLLHIGNACRSDQNS